MVARNSLRVNFGHKVGFQSSGPFNPPPPKTYSDFLCTLNASTSTMTDAMRPSTTTMSRMTCIARGVGKNSPHVGLQTPISSSKCSPSEQFSASVEAF